jgi:hypothetical protein
MTMRKAFGLMTARTAVLFLPLAAAPLQAQSQDVVAGVLGGVERYTFSEPAAVGIRSVMLITAPFAAQVRLVPNTYLSLSGAVASGSVERDDGSTASLTGLTDTELRVTYSMPRYVSVSGAVMLPTGKSTHTAEEAEVASIVAADLLPFRVSNWGSGGGLDVSATLAIPAGNANVGARVGYQVAREFEPLDGESFAYRPGNQFYGRLAVDYNVGSSGKASAHLTLQQFSADVSNGQNLYQSGNRLQFIGSYAFVAGPRSTALVYAGALHRARPTLFGESLQRPTQNLLLAGGGMRVPTAFGVLTPGVDLRVFRSEDGLGQGYAAGLGSSAEFRIGSDATLAPSVRARIGNLVLSDGVESGLLGIDVGLGVRFGRAATR